MKLIPKCLQFLDFLKRILLKIAYFRNPVRRNFIKENSEFWKSFDEGIEDQKELVLVEGVSGNDYWSLLVSTSAAILGYAHRAKTAYLLESSSEDSFKQAIQLSFGNVIFFIEEELTKDIEEKLKKKCQSIYASLNNTDDLLKLTYKGTYIGSCVYDNYLKHRHATIKDLYHKDRICDLIYRSIRKIESIEKIRENYNIKAGFYTHTTSVYCGIPFRHLLKNKIPVFSNAGGLGMIQKYTGFESEIEDMFHSLCIPYHFFDSIYRKNKIKVLQVASKFLEDRISGKAKDYDAAKAFAQDKHLFEDKNEFCDKYNLDASKPIAFVMLHGMNDDPHYAIHHIFKDFYDWFLKTLKYAQELDEVNWVFKQHPSTKFYPDDANLDGIFESIENANIVYMDENDPFNPASIVHLGAAVVTAAGTAALEYTCFGVPAIVASSHYYTGYDIVHEAFSLEEYKNSLSNIPNLHKVNVKKQNKAKVLFWLVHEVALIRHISGVLSFRDWQGARKVTADESLNEYLLAIRDSKSKVMHRKIEDLISFIRENLDNKDSRQMYLELPEYIKN